MKQLNDFNWKYVSESKKYIPVFRLYDYEEDKVQTIELPNYQFNFKLSKEKYCTGYYKEGKYHPCAAKNLVGSFALQCQTCQQLEGFVDAFFMKRPPSESMKIQLAQKHFLYLAYFEPGLLKVGTAAEARKSIRTIEQDALIYTFIAESDGFNIQKIERFISKNFNISEYVKSAHKLTFISQKPDIHKATSLIDSMLDRIHAKINVSIEVELNFKLIPRNQVQVINLSHGAYYPLQFKKEFEESNLFGTFKGLRGRYLIIENAGKDYLFDVNLLIGRNIDYLDNYIYNEESQLSFI